LIEIRSDANGASDVVKALLSQIENNISKKTNPVSKVGCGFAIVEGGILFSFCLR
jgi:hypothetical protein